MHRRSLIAGLAAAPLLATLPFAIAGGAAGADLPVLAVAKSPSCGCCSAWVEHMRAAGFRVETQDVTDETLATLKRRLGLAPDQMSCHTARVDGYVIEGHVPAEDVHRLLAERPEARGLAVPGMPAGSPGMEMGDMRDAYDTLLIGRTGRRRSSPATDVRRGPAARRSVQAGPATVSRKERIVALGQRPAGVVGGDDVIRAVVGDEARVRDAGRQRTTLVDRLLRSPVQCSTRAGARTFSSSAETSTYSITSR